MAWVPFGAHYCAQLHPYALTEAAVTKSTNFNYTAFSLQTTSRRNSNAILGQSYHRHKGQYLA